MTLDLRLIALLGLTALNGLAFAAFYVDKRRAIHGNWRIPEKTLLALALVAAALGPRSPKPGCAIKPANSPLRPCLISLWCFIF